MAALAAEAGISEEQVLEALNAQRAHDSVPLEPAGEPAGEFSGAIDDRLALSSAMRALPRRERTILHLRFVEGLTQTEIADRVGLSQMYVSRLLRATLEQLRDQIEPSA